MFIKYPNYYFKVIARRKLSGKYYNSNGNTSSYYAGYFHFYTTYK